MNSYFIIIEEMASNNFVKTVNNVDIFTQRYPQADMAKHLSSTSQATQCAQAIK